MGGWTWDATKKWGREEMGEGRDGRTLVGAQGVCGARWHASETREPSLTSPPTYTARHPALSVGRLSRLQFHLLAISTAFASVQASVASYVDSPRVLSDVPTCTRATLLWASPRGQRGLFKCRSDADTRSYKLAGIPTLAGSASDPHPSPARPRRPLPPLGLPVPLAQYSPRTANQTLALLRGLTLRVPFPWASRPS